MCYRMGTHPNGPAALAADEAISLKSWLQGHPSALGDKVLEQFHRDLPFLFKVTAPGKAGLRHIIVVNSDSNRYTKIRYTVLE